MQKRFQQLRNGNVLNLENNYQITVEQIVVKGGEVHVNNGDGCTHGSFIFPEKDFDKFPSSTDPDLPELTPATAPPESGPVGTSRPRTKAQKKKDAAKRAAERKRHKRQAEKEAKELAESH